MGWSGYSLYSGDGTQTCHYDFIHTAIPLVSNDQICDEDWLGSNKTKIPKKYQAAFIKGIPNILKKIKVPKFWDEDSAIEWQMLLSLFIDNKLKVPPYIINKGLQASNYLLSPSSHHCEDFDEPSKRRAVIRNFIKKVSTHIGRVAKPLPSTSLRCPYCGSIKKEK